MKRLRINMPLRLIAPLLLAGWCLFASGQEEAEEDLAEEALAAALPPELAEMFPIGREFRGVAIPTYTKDVLSTVMRSDSITRIDEQYLDLKNLVISIYNGAGEAETTITMARASYDLVIGELVSKTPSKIEQPKFTMTGKKMTFKTQTQISLLEGDVKLVVPDVSGITPDFGFPNSSKNE